MDARIDDAKAQVDALRQKITGAAFRNEPYSFPDFNRALNRINDAIEALRAPDLGKRKFDEVIDLTGSPTAAPSPRDKQKPAEAKSPVAPGNGGKGKGTMSNPYGLGNGGKGKDFMLYVCANKSKYIPDQA